MAKVTSLSLRIVLLLLVVHVAFTSMSRLLVYDDGNLLLVASVPAFVVLSWMILFGFLGVWLANGWALAMFSLAGFLVVAFYEPDPLVATLNSTLIVSVMVASQSLYPFPHVIEHIKKGSKETVSLHLFRALRKVSLRLVLAGALSLLITLAPSLDSQVQIRVETVSLLAFLLLGSLGISLALLSRITS